MRAANIERKQYLLHRQAICQLVSKITGQVVAAGPFAGMWVHPKPAWEDGNLSTKLIGCYEHELHWAIEVAARRQPKTIINVGCADGFYAVGMARLIPDASVVAYDIDPQSLELCRESAIRNRVSERISTLPGCWNASQLAVGRHRRLLVLDCEGHELDLLDLALCPSLAESDMIIECHDYLRPGISGILAKRFSDTHVVGYIEPSSPSVRDYPFLASLPFGVLLEAVTELRPPGTIWLVCLTT